MRNERVTNLGNTFDDREDLISQSNATNIYHHYLMNLNGNHFQSKGLGHIKGMSNGLRHPQDTKQLTEPSTFDREDLVSDMSSRIEINSNLGS
jgi:hypothetical protein